MLKQSIQTNSIIVGAAKVIDELRALPDEQFETAIKACYDTLRGIGLPANGMAMLFGVLVQEVEEETYWDEPGQLKCQLCEEDAASMVTTVGGINLVVCPRCGEHMLSVGAKLAEFIAARVRIND